MSKLSTFLGAGLLSLIGFSATTPAQATSYTEVTVRIETATETIFNDQVYVADDGYTITDSTGEAHTLTQPVALCALEAAASAGEFKYTVDDSAYGLYLSAIKKNVASTTDYWLFDINYRMAAVGVAEAELANGDDVLFKYGGWPNSALQLTAPRKQLIVGQQFRGKLQIFNEVTQAFEPLAGATVHITDSISRTTNADGRFNFKPTTTDTLNIYAEADGYVRSNTVTVPVFARNLKRRVLVPATLQAMAKQGSQYLLSEIDKSGGLIAANQSVTEWAAIALGSTNDSTDILNQTVLAYEPTVNDGTTEIARHILALAAIGEDTRNANGIDFVERLEATEHNNQYGSVDYVNDDIFAALALLASDEPVNSKAIEMALTAAASGLNDDGGVSYAVAIDTSDVDTTAYYIQLLQAVGGHNKILRQAMRYLTHQQNLDGGFGYSAHSASNTSSTAVALQALGQRGLVLARNKRTGFNFLETAQRDTGAFQYGTAGGQSVEQLNTAYAIPALMFSKLVN